MFVDNWNLCSNSVCIDLVNLLDCLWEYCYILIWNAVIAHTGSITLFVLSRPQDTYQKQTMLSQKATYLKMVVENMTYLDQINTKSL